ncbi:MAG: lipopolysaccharide biosynthesis protein [Streptosporangiaceae bacterium]
MKSSEQMSPAPPGLPGTSHDLGGRPGQHRAGSHRSGSRAGGPPPPRRPAEPAARSRAAAQADRASLAEVARGSTLNLAGAGISAAATLGLTVLVTREFSTSVAGAFFAATSLFLILEAITNLGAYNGTVYFITRLRSLHAEHKIPRILRAAVIPVVLVSTAGAVAMAVFADPLARVLLHGDLGGGAGHAAVAGALRALAVALPFAALTDTFLGASRGYRNMRPTVVIDRIGRSGLQLAAVLIAAMLGSAALLAPLWAVPYVPAAIIGWLWLRRIDRRTRPRRRQLVAVRGVTQAGPYAGLRYVDVEPETRPFPVTRRDQQIEDSVLTSATPRGFWKFNAPRALAATAQIVIQRLDIVLVGIIKGPVDAAIYTAATRFLVVGQLGNIAISMAAQPQFTHLFAVRDRRGANMVYQATTAWLVVLAWPLYLLAATYGPQVLGIFGHSYQAGATVMVILSLAMLVSAGCGQVDMVLTTAGRSSWSLANGLLAMATNVAADLVLIPRYGITGAAIGWAAAIAVFNLMPLIQVAVVLRVHPFGRGAAIACGLTAVSFGLIPLAVRLAAGPGLVSAAVAVAAGCAVMAAGLWRFRDVLQLAVMPGVAQLAGRVRRHTAARPGGAG